MRSLGQGLWNLLIAMDQLGNVLIGLTVGGVRGRSDHYGDPDETISSVLGRKANKQNTNRLEQGLIYLLDKLDTNHVIDAIESPRPRNKILKAPRDE